MTIVTISSRGGDRTVVLCASPWFGAIARAIRRKPISAYAERMAIKMDSEHWAGCAVDDVAHAMHTGSSGLGDAEARTRLERYGPNAMRAHHVSALAVLGRQFRNAVLIMLLVTAALAALLGDRSDAIIIAVILTASIGLGFANEYAAERTSAKLQSTISQSAVVVRDGVARSIPSRELVPGDVVQVGLGSRVPADLRLIEADDLSCDESVISGESLPAEKSVDAVSGSASLADLDSMAFMGTIVASGSGRGIVVATGASTEMGQVAAGLSRHAPETSFQAGLRRFSVLLVWFAAALIVMIVATSVFLHRSLLESVLFALAIAVGITPQLLPAVVNSSLSMGTRRLARHKVLVKRLVCIEDLGNIEVLVTDKTGTLTQGAMTLQASLDASGHADESVARRAALAVAQGGGSAGTTDALDSALTHAVPSPEPTAIVARLPFDHERMRASVLTADGTLVCKGAPESIFGCCDRVSDEAKAVAERELNRGGRVLAVATKGITAGSSLTAGDESGMDLLGFLVFSDPPRLDARAAIERLESLGIRLVIATGDHPAVAADLVSRLGMNPGKPLTGADIDAMDDDELSGALATATILARVSPQQKQRAVAMLRAGGRTVGFLGDGVNDALALHSADVGISVDTATDVAKDAADIILLEKSLAVIAGGVTEGRKIFANTLKYVYMSGSGNFGNMLSAAAASAFLPFLPMLPGQILLGNLLYDSSQLTISSDRVDAAQVRSPARWDIGGIGRFMLIFGALSSLFDMMTFALLLGVFNANAVLFHSGWFVESLVTQTLVVLVIRTRRTPFVRSRPSLPLAAALVAVIVVAVALPFSPLAPTLGLVALPASMMWAIAGITVAYLALADFAKFMFYRAQEHRAHQQHPARVRAVRRALRGMMR